MRFVFVHGGFHAAWCWDHTIAELQRRGHEAVAVDLPGHGTRVDDALDAWTIPDRRDAILEALRPGDVLVGHSGGGFDATVAADAATDLIGHIVPVFVVIKPNKKGPNHEQIHQLSCRHTSARWQGNL